MSTALYRRYRPDTFADVIGQEHVTTPLMTALSKNRVNHAYLFSGPRGCGKTTSARILARCLNCVEGPTPTPCGKCESCVELASGGPGSLDVIEIDAASHGGVEDARDLRERATFAPARDRYKVFIIDEAHMVTSAGFNALLKIVEEPPPHIKFIFATTEPDKVIGTIRSRTHHYPFRLVPPEALLEYLKTLCERENVTVEEGVLPLVIRAGGGSVRDTLSVLDQLMAGASDRGVDYETAIALLGYTHATLLDEVSLALHEADGASLFDAIDRIIQTGLDPRRFVEDLLERFRDLIIAKAVPEGLEKILRGIPADQLQSLADQSALFGSAELSRWADVTNQALTDMTGATSPRLHLELLAARLLLPAADSGERSIAARLDRLERHAMTGGALPDLPEDSAGQQAPASFTASPESTRQGAAAVREALAAARARKQGQPDEPAMPEEPEPSSQPQASEPSPGLADEAPLDDSGSLNTGPDADWGATWGPIEDAKSHPVTTPVDPSPSVPATRPEGVSPFSLVPDPNSGEDLSFGTGVPIDDVKQNAAMVEFAKRAAAQRSQQAQQAQATHQQPQQQPNATQVEGEQAAQREAAERAEQQRQAEEAARREQTERDQAAQRQAAEREAAQRAEQQRRMQEPQQRQQPPTDEAQASAPQPSGGAVQAFQQAWPSILGQLQSNSKVLHSMLANYANIAGFDGRTLTLAFSNSGPLVNLRNRPDMMGLLTNTIGQVMRQQVEVVLTEGGSGPSGGGSPKGDRRPQPASAPVAERQLNAAADAPALSSPSPTHPDNGAAPMERPRMEASRQESSSPAEPPYEDEPPYDPYEDAYPPEDFEPPRFEPQPARQQSSPELRQEAAPAAAAPSITRNGAARGPRSFDGPPIAPRPRMTAGLAARQAEEGALPVVPPAAGAFGRPVSDTPLRPGSTTDSFPTPAAQAESAGQRPAPAANQQGPVERSQPVSDMVPPGSRPGATSSAPTWGQPQEPPSPGQNTEVQPPVVPVVPSPGQRLSRYQQLMNQANSTPGAAVQANAGGWGQPQRTAAQQTPPEPEPEDFIPSEDDIAVEDSTLIGVPAIERLLGGMVIEQRDANGNVIEIRRSL